MTTQTKKMFLGLQRELKAKLESGAQSLTHPGEKGGNSEVNWLEMMNTYLPRRYLADRAQIADCEGNLSDQIDIVIFDAQFTPPLYQGGGTRIVTAESVYAVLEVKQDLSKAHLDYTADKAKSVRTLKRTSVEISHAGGKFPAKAPHRILAGLLSLRTTWKGDVADHVRANCNFGDAERQIDFGCCLEAGSFETQSDGSVAMSATDVALASFFWSMLAKLQTLGTVPALDHREYMRRM